jgi:hypothetical protein
MNKNPLHDYCPDASRFDLEWLEPVVEAGVTLRPCRMTTFRLPDGPVRTYGMVGFPEGQGPFPAILHIHGGCQTVSRGNLLYNIRRGYAAMSFDWGFWGTEPARTVYPESIPPVFDLLATLEHHDVTHTYPFLAACAARGCLALLASLPEVDRERIGVYGISWGGFIAWLVNGTDGTPKCAVPIYGTGGLSWPMHPDNAAWGRASDVVRRRWARSLEPAGYACTQRSPVLHLNGTNDFFGGFDTAAQMLPTIPMDWRCDYTPNTNHGIDVGSRLAMEAWFDHHLRGGPPVPVAPPVRVVVTGDSAIRVETEGHMDEVAVWASFGSAPFPLRCWGEHKEWRRLDGGGLACELVATGDAWIFVRFTDRQTGLTLSSTPICLSMPRAKVTPDALLFGAPNRLDGWGFQYTVEPAAAGSMAGETVIDENGLTIRSDCERRLSFLFFGMNRPESRPPAGVDTLVVELEGCNWPGLSCVAGASYEWKAENPADGVHRLTADQFRDSNGAPLSGFEQVAYMVAWPLPRPGASARIRRMAWDISSDGKARISHVI